MAIEEIQTDDSAAERNLRASDALRCEYPAACKGTRLGPAYPDLGDATSPSRWDSRRYEYSIGDRPATGTSPLQAALMESCKRRAARGTIAVLNRLLAAPIRVLAD